MFLGSYLGTVPMNRYLLVCTTCTPGTTVSRLACFALQLVSPRFTDLFMYFAALSRFLATMAGDYGGNAGAIGLGGRWTHARPERSGNPT